MRSLGILLSSLAMAAASSFVAMPSASASTWYVDTHKACNYHKYPTHYTVAVSSRAPALTHIQVYGMPPSASHTVTKSVKYSTTLRASVRSTTSVSIGASGITKVISKASASTSLSLAASGSHTKTTATTVTDTIRNPTGKNAAFVFYAGDTFVKGSFRKYFCEQTHSYSAWTVRYVPGKWQSYAIYQDGAARCGLSGVTALQKLALKVGCR